MIYYKVRCLLFISLILLAIIKLSGCTVDGRLSEEERNKIIRCEDFRDGEVFKFRTDSVSNVRIGIGAPTSFDVIDMNGRERTLSGDMEKYIKCEDITNRNEEIQ